MTTPAHSSLLRVPAQIADSGEIEEFLSNGPKAPVKVLQRAREDPLRVVAVDTSNLTHSRLLMPDLVAQMGTTAIPWVLHLVGGRCEQSGRGSEGRHVAGNAWLTLPTDGPVRLRTDGARLRVTHFDPALLAEAASETEPEAWVAGTVRFTSNEPLSRAGGRRWDVISRFASDLFADDEAADHPLVIRNTERLLAGAALSIFPNTAILDPTATDRRDANVATVNRARTFIEDNCAESIGLTEIARAANVTNRAVQLAFRRHLNATPTAYLRTVRLDRARRDLVNADPRHETVAAVAARWGFTPSRFAFYYHQAYGVLPSRTLKDK
jgi:AraC-like DNA-binding protein